jgi:hypothetical protein
MSLSLSRARAAWLAFGITLPVNVATMNRAIGFIDRGELAAAAATFGIPHATGYPTLMLLAGTLVHLSPLRPVLTLNLLAATLVAAGAAMLTLLLERLMAATAPDLEPRLRARYALLAGVFVAFTMTWWQQANGFEVYALHALLMPLVVLLFLRWIDAAATEDPHTTSSATGRAGFAFGLVLGLSFTNHLSTLLLAPGLLLVSVLRFGAGSAWWRHIAAVAPAFLLGLLPYAWLPIRSRMQPRFDWGNPESWGAFLHHVTGADYRGWMFADPVSMSLQGRYLAWRLPGDFLWVGLVVALVGLILLFGRARHHALMVSGIVAAGIVFAVGYRIADLDAYLLTAVLGIGLAYGAGLLRLHERFGSRAATLAGLALVIAGVAAHWRECDERPHRWVENSVHDLLGPLPPRAVLFTDTWGIAEAGTYYYQAVERFRPDVVVVSPNLSRASWYLDELERRAPDIVAHAGSAFGAWRRARRAIDSGAPYRVDEAVALHARCLEALVVGCAQVRPVFTTGALLDVRPDWQRVPFHLALQLRPDTAYVPEPSWSLAFRLRGGRTDANVARTCQAYAESRLERATYEARHGRIATADSLRRQALAFDPRIRAQDVGPLPLGVDHDVLRTARFFRELETAALASAGR